MIEIEHTKYVLPPGRFAEPCPISGLPLPEGTTWLDLPAVIKTKHVEQKSCNKRIAEFRVWLEAVKALQEE